LGIPRKNIYLCLRKLLTKTAKIYEIKSNYSSKKKTARPIMGFCAAQ
jgi:hypothetical protein